MIFDQHVIDVNFKRILIIGITYCLFETLGLILSTMGLFESDIRGYVLIIVLFHVLILPIIYYRNNSKVIKIYFDTTLINVYISVIIGWGILFTTLMYIEQQDITIISVVMILCASLFLIKPSIFRVVMFVNFGFYALMVYMKIDSQLTINSLWFKGLLFFALSFVIGYIHYNNQMNMYNLQVELEKKNTDLADLANRDSLSKLYNNAYIYHYLEKKLNEIEISDPLAVLMMDIDNFKSINDSYGHLFGDLVIKSIAEELRSATEVYDVLGRYGGEEFVVILNKSDIERSIYIAEVIRTNIENLRFEYPAKVTISIGISFYNGGTAKELIKSADDQLYRAKALGKNRVVRD
jgi:diguanylate cyclase (GGDEF)-like protein